MGQRFRHGRSGPSWRPFGVSAGVRDRGYFRPLERAITDFGADVPFGQISQKLQEHHGIEVPSETARQIAEKQGGQMLEQQVLETEIPDRPGVAVELDGSIIPVVRRAEPKPGRDRRSTRQLPWQEARLALAYRFGAEVVFAA